MEGAAPAQSVFFKPQEVVVTDTWPPPSIPMVATPTRPQQQQPSQHPPQQPTRPAADSWHTLQGVSSSWARSQGQQPAGMQYRSGGGGTGMRDPRTVQPPPPPAEIASSWGEAAELEALYHTKVAETLHHVVDPIVYDEAVALIEEHRAAGRDIVIVSASGTEVVEPIGELLGADTVVATRMEVEDGCYTGEIETYVYAEQKAVDPAEERLRGLAPDEFKVRVCGHIVLARRVSPSSMFPGSVRSPSLSWSTQVRRAHDLGTPSQPRPLSPLSPHRQSSHPTAGPTSEPPSRSG